jgi:hypothetical protein
MAEQQRKKLADTGPSWLYRNPAAWRRGLHPTRCRWCGTTLNLCAVRVLASVTVVTECPVCDRPGPSIEGGPLH